MRLTPATLTDHIDGDIRTVKTVKLQSKGITEIEDLSVCVDMQKLILKDNKIKDLSGLVYCKGLTYLTLEANNLQNIKGLKHLVNLHVLNLSDNQLQLPTEEWEKQFVFLEKLQALVVKGNKIRISRPFKLLKNINTLVVSHNVLEEIDSIARLAHLTKVSASFNKLRTIPSGLWLAGLQELRLSHNSFLTIPIELTNTPHLRVLDLGSNMISDFRNISVIKSLRSLVNLTMKGNPIQENPEYTETYMGAAPHLLVFDDKRVIPKKGKRKAEWKPQDSYDYYAKLAAEQNGEAPQFEEKVAEIPAPVAVPVVLTKAQMRAGKNKRMRLDLDEEETKTETEKETASSPVEGEPPKKRSKISETYEEPLAPADEPSNSFAKKEKKSKRRADPLPEEEEEEEQIETPKPKKKKKKEKKEKKEVVQETEEETRDEKKIQEMKAKSGVVKVIELGPKKKGLAKQPAFDPSALFAQDDQDAFSKWD